jgi:hypothetical protein
MALPSFVELVAIASVAQATGAAFPAKGGPPPGQQLVLDRD